MLEQTQSLPEHEQAAPLHGSRHALKLSELHGVLKGQKKIRMILKNNRDRSWRQIIVCFDSGGFSAEHMLIAGSKHSTRSKCGSHWRTSQPTLMSPQGCSRGGRCSGRPEERHRAMGGLSADHFGPWVKLFELTTRDVCPAFQAGDFLIRASQMRQGMTTVPGLEHDRADPADELTCP